MKISMYVDLFKSVHRFQIQITLALVFCAVALSFGAFGAIEETIDIVKRNKAFAEMVKARIEAKSTTFSDSEISGIVKQLSASHPELLVKAKTSGTIHIAVNNSIAYGDWRAAIADAYQAGPPGTVVDTVSICAAACAGSFAEVELTFKRLRFDVV